MNLLWFFREFIVNAHISACFSSKALTKRRLPAAQSRAPLGVGANVEENPAHALWRKPRQRLCARVAFRCADAPPLTEERRKLLTKQAKQEAENAKISIRNSRRDAIDLLKKSIKLGVSEDLEKDAEADMQTTHDQYIKKVDELFVAKEKEIMTV